jgi:hypothetical protein
MRRASASRSAGGGGRRIKATIADTMIAATGGAVEPAGWRRSNAYPRAAGGQSALLVGTPRMGAAAAAWPTAFSRMRRSGFAAPTGAGVHPGATIVPAVLRWRRRSAQMPQLHRGGDAGSGVVPLRLHAPLFGAARLPRAGLKAPSAPRCHGPVCAVARQRAGNRSRGVARGGLLISPGAARPDGEAADIGRAAEAGYWNARWRRAGCAGQRRARRPMGFLEAYWRGLAGAAGRRLQDTFEC